MMNERSGGHRTSRQDDGSSTRAPEDYSQRRFDQHGGQSGGQWHRQNVGGFGSMGGTAQDSPQRYGGMSSAQSGARYSSGMSSAQSGARYSSGMSSAQGGPRHSGKPFGSGDNQHQREQQPGAEPRHQVYEENHDNWRAQQMAQFDQEFHEFRRSRFTAEFEQWRRNRAQMAALRSNSTQPPTSEG